jgi:cation diffusion facilitator CzcD-associated flavoprotein CzcO
VIDVAVIGGGVAGIGMAARLKRAGRDDFLVFERAERLGGTWRDNTYPGVACDIPSRLYSYSFREKPDWSHRFAPGGEILEYLEDTARAEGVLPHVRLGEALTAAAWDDDARLWQLETTRGGYEARSLVMAAGRLSEPRLPAVPGLERFAGRVFHSARWDDRPLDGLRVGVVGTGASAVQLLPEVARRAAAVAVFQRSAAWVLPRGDRAFAPGEQQPDRAELAAEAEACSEPGSRARPSSMRCAGAPSPTSRPASRTRRCAQPSPPTTRSGASARCSATTTSPRCSSRTSRSRRARSNGSSAGPRSRHPHAATTSTC